jgi:ADP-ribose 1''-phosphate phosphatase
MGRWGAGIAVEFRNRFPDEYMVYQAMCARNGPIAGYGYIINSRVGCIVSSKGYGPKADSPEIILQQTIEAIPDILKACPAGMEIHSPKINAGLFKVSFELTAQAIAAAVNASEKPVKWVVWDLKL